SWELQGAAQVVPNHLRCQKVEDTQAKAVYTADLNGLVAEPGCSIKVPGVLSCTETREERVTPQPPGGDDDAGAAGRFLCYKVKCAQAVSVDIPWHDQFGTRTLTLKKKGDLVCAPGRILGPPASCDTDFESCGSCGSGRCSHHCGVIGLPFICVDDASFGPAPFCLDDTDCPPEAPICGGLPRSSTSCGTIGGFIAPCLEPPGPNI